MRILIIEDEEALAQSMRKGLESEGFAADVVHDGEAGLSMASLDMYDAVVLDILLPKRNGFSVCAELRRQGITTPVVMLTAKDGELDETEALDTGADDYLTKPLSLAVLAAHLRAVLRRSTNVRPPVLEAGDLQLDPSARTVMRGDSPIQLTNREFTILEYLMHNAGQVLSKAQIIDHTWDFNFEGDVNIVEVYMSYLRQKIDRPFKRNAIETVRGVGYRLDKEGG